MRRVVVTEFMTLDGVIEDPGGAEDFAHGGWSFKFPDPEGAKYKLDEVMQFDALLLGRVTYEVFAAAWPDRADEAGFADKMNSMAKYVVSSTLTEAGWNNSTIISGDVAEEVARLKQEDGGDILVGGSQTLLQALREHDLVDEYRLMVFPLVLGSGRRLFTEDTGTPTELRLTGSKTLSSGTVILTYEPAL